MLNGAQSRRDLADMYRSEQRFHEAEAAYREVLTLKPTDLAAIGGLAIVRRQIGNPGEALEWFEHAAAIDPRNDWIKYERVITLRDLGRGGEAVALFESIDVKSSVYFWSRTTLGHMARATGAHQSALAYFEQAVDAAGDPEEALSQIAAANQALGDIAAGRAAIARIFARDPESYWHLRQHEDRGGGDLHRQGPQV